jgi:DNA-binding CsgD family transcriptional regulator
MSSSSRIAVAKNRLAFGELAPLQDASDDLPESSGVGGRTAGGPAQGGRVAGGPAESGRMAGGSGGPVTHRRPHDSAVEPWKPPSPPLHPAWRAALEAEACSASGFDLPSLWGDLVRGRLRIWEESFVLDRIVLLARVSDVGERLSDSDALMVVRILSGDQQKLVASEFGIASSTGSSRYLRALGRLELSRQHVPLTLVLAAQSASGVRPVPPARSGFFNHHQNAYVFVSVRSPDTARMTQLTAAEQAVARFILSGHSRLEIAGTRETSIHTVARQFHSIFEAMKVTGRFALIRRAVELRAFDE